MRIFCNVCKNQCIQVDAIAAAPCGHTFHSVCLIQSIERSKCCPLCRRSAIKKDILKLFFDAGNLDYDEVESDSLQHKIANLKIVIQLRDQVISNMREESKRLEKMLRDKDSTNLTLQCLLKFKEQMKTDAQQNAQGNAKALRKELSLLQKKLHKYRDKISGLGVQMKELKKHLNGVSAQLSSTEQSKKLLETDVLNLEKENASLRKEVDALLSAIVSPSGDVKNCLIAESSDPSHLKRPQTSDDNVMVATPEVVKKLASLEAEQDDLECQGSFFQRASQASSSPEESQVCSSPEESQVSSSPEEKVVKKVASLEAEQDDLECQSSFFQKANQVGSSPEEKVVKKLASLEAEQDDLECQGSFFRRVSQASSSPEESQVSSSPEESQVSSSPEEKLIFLHGRKPLADETNVSKSSRKRHHNIVAKNEPHMMNVGINLLPNRSQPNSCQISYIGRPLRSRKKKPSFQTRLESLATKYPRENFVKKTSDDAK